MTGIQKNIPLNQALKQIIHKYQDQFSKLNSHIYTYLTQQALLLLYFTGLKNVKVSL